MGHNYNINHNHRYTKEGASGAVAPPPSNFGRNGCFRAIFTEAFGQIVRGQGEISVVLVLFTTKFCSKYVAQNVGNGMVFALPKFSSPLRF